MLMLYSYLLLLYAYTWCSSSSVCDCSTCGYMTCSSIVQLLLTFKLYHCPVMMRACDLSRPCIKTSLYIIIRVGDIRIIFVLLFGRIWIDSPLLYKLDRLAVNAFPVEVLAVNVFAAIAPDAVMLPPALAPVAVRDDALIAPMLFGAALTVPTAY